MKKNIFDYYQNETDPTFENYKPEFSLQLVQTNEICYYSTAFKILKQGKSLSCLIRIDLQNFIYKWLTVNNESSIKWVSISRNGVINFVLADKEKNYGSLKYVCIVKKYSEYRPVGLKAVRELDYLV